MSGELGPLLFGSLTRIADLPDREIELQALPRDRWMAGDYVLARVLRAEGRSMESRNGRRVELQEGDRVVGALGKREATLEAVGDWERVRKDGVMHVLTGGGLLGRCTSRSSLVGPLATVSYLGHVAVNGRVTRMRDWVEAVPERRYTLPTVVIVGTSMSAGKTTAARTLIRQLAARGRRVVGAKLTGAGRYRDVLTMGDAGACPILDFVDVGLPSTVCPPDVFRPALSQMLARIEAAEADVAAVEIGASPLEPYNGDVAFDAIRSRVALSVLCASDPYAVLGVMSAFDFAPDLVTGIATNTAAGIRLVERLAGVRALNLTDPRALPRLRSLLSERLGS